MNKELLTLIALWFAIISVVTAAVTAADKIKAKRGSRRISEKSLFTLALLGGSIAEYFTMRLIRHKTLHKKFMLGLPLMIILQLVISVIVYYFTLKSAT
ncbi:MAG: DUF1294 domain-containing protein [Clostridia bacterium]|nr:DUF1294 domain-containing protein [Clostridia bacterium]